jgi:hypothetical protein
MHGDSDEKAASDGDFPILRDRGRPRKGGVIATDSTFLKPSEKNTRTHWLARLARDRPDIHARVVGGEISAHRGMIEAGFRRRIERRKKRIWPTPTGVDVRSLIG